MQVGISFPTTEIGRDPAVIRDFAQAVEGMGYRHLTCIDHVLGAGTPADGRRAYYARSNMFHEPLVLFGFLAAVTTTIEMATAVMILPQRQTALVAKQAAEVDLLSGGRLRLGVGLGWNEVEYEALNENFKTRARRFVEQIEVMRKLWSEDLVTFKGEFHTLSDVGLNPEPVRRPIPVWAGAFEPPAIRRAARIADGWFINPATRAGNEAAVQIATFRDAATEAGRDAAGIPIDGTVYVTGKTIEEIAAEAAAWQRLGVTHLTIRTMTAGLKSPDEHIDLLRRLKPALPAG